MVSSKESLVFIRQCCPVCNSKNFKIRFNSKHNGPGFFDFIKIEQFYSKEFYEAYNNGPLGDLIYEIAECDDCQFYFLTEVLNDQGMVQLYNDWLDKDLLKVFYSKEKYSFYEETMLRIIKNHFRKKSPVNIMDFGAGYGSFCSIASKLGFNTHAFDLSSDKNEHINNLGVKIINKFDNYSGYFDFIFVNQVFEHLSDPGKELENLQKCLSKNGLIYIAVPDCKNINEILIQKGLSPELFELLSPHQHINAFTNNTLKQLAIRAGLKPLGMFDFMGMLNAKLSFKELVFLSKKIIRNSYFNTGLFFSNNR